MADINAMATYTYVKWLDTSQPFTTEEITIKADQVDADAPELGVIRDGIMLEKSGTEYIIYVAGVGDKNANRGVIRGNVKKLTDHTCRATIVVGGNIWIEKLINHHVDMDTGLLTQPGANFIRKEDF